MSELKEDASLLRLGQDFQGARCLWNAEVVIVLEHRLSVIDKEKDDMSSAHSRDLIQETLDYVKLFNNYQNRETITAARETLKKYDKVDQFEIAVLNNLNLETVDEALSLVPTLKQKLEPEQIEQLLEDMRRYQNTA